ncbi:unnamed protein product, partial [Coregonus sp. 'balchen']
MIPPGLHFLHYRSSNAPDLGERSGWPTGTPKRRIWTSASQNEEEVGRVWVDLQDLDPF